MNSYPVGTILRVEVEEPRISKGEKTIRTRHRIAVVAQDTGAETIDVRLRRSPGLRLKYGNWAPMAIAVPRSSIRGRVPKRELG